jgi:AraC family transcriptional regulator
MQLTPEVKLIPAKMMIGKKLTLSLTDNKTTELWRSFMPYRKYIKDSVGSAVYSINIYPAGYFENFDPSREYEKWAAVEASGSAPNPAEMKNLIIPAGLYAIFHYKGSSLDSRIFQYIYSEWLPASEYMLDARPHFEILGEKYKNADPDSEEDIYIPVKPK